MGKEVLDFITATSTVICVGILLRVGWSLTGHFLYRLGIRDIANSTTINNHSHVVINGEERAA